MSEWKPIDTYRRPDEWRHQVDLWMKWEANPLQLRPFGDAFRVPDAWQDKNGKWFHLYNGKKAELAREFITYWMPVPPPPQPEAERT